MTDRKKTCFIAMPLTTQPETVADYHGDREHFVHVLEHLFVPAVEAAGFEPIRPIMSGSDLIHAQIIKHLEEADLVLVDVSRLNPNVFFELGIRTALDRPAALVRDQFTPVLPFDTSNINTESYDGSLSAWTLKAQIAKLADHLREVEERSADSNPLWRYFGLTKRAQQIESDASPLEAKLDLVLSHMRNAGANPDDEPLSHEEIWVRLRRAASRYGVSPVSMMTGETTVYLTTDRPVPPKLAEMMREIAAHSGRDLEVHHSSDLGGVLDRALDQET